MSNSSQIVLGSLFGLFIVVFMNLWAIERDQKLFEMYCDPNIEICLK